MQIVSQWEIFEWELLYNGILNNPFIDVDVQATFINGQNSHTVDGFYDGENRWLIRFSPGMKGEWQGTTVSNISELDGKTISLICDEPISKGALTINSQFPHWFFHQDGTPFFLINDGWYPHPLFNFRLDFEELEFAKPSESNMETYLKILGDHGVNLTLEVDQLYARQSSIEDPSFNWPWKVLDEKNNKIDKELFNLEFYQRMDRTLSYAKEHSVFYGLELLFDNSVFRPREWSSHPLNVNNGGWLEGDSQQTGWRTIFDLSNAEHVKYIRRYLKYTVARFAAYWNVVWALGAESGNIAQSHGHEIPNKDIIDWYEYWGDYIARRDPYGRLQSIGDTGEMQGLIQNSRNNFIITQEHTSMDNLPDFCKATNDFGERFWKYGRPVLIGEQDRHNLNKCYAERIGYWVAFVSGFHMGRVDRHFGVAEDGILIEGKKFFNNEIPPIYLDLKNMKKFIDESKMQFWRMLPNDKLLSNKSNEGIFCLAEEGYEYLIYFAYGGNASLATSSGKCCWYNPRSGEFKEILTLQAGTQTFSAPDNQDWVLHVSTRK